MNYHFLKIVALVIICLSGHNSLWAQSPSVLKQKIVRLSDSIHAHGFLYGTRENNLDSLESWNSRLIKLLREWPDQDATFMDEEDPLGNEHRLQILTSDDHYFRIICWNDGMSGTLQEWRAIAFWKKEQGVGSKILVSDEHSDDIYGLTPEYLNIMDFKLKDGKIVYWVDGIGHGSNRIKFSFVKAFAINKNGGLNDYYRFFKTPHRKLNHISLRIDLISVPQDDYDPFIFLSDDSRTMYIPVANKTGKLKLNKHLIYQFDGKSFVFKKVK